MTPVAHFVRSLVDNQSVFFYEKRKKKIRGA
jgi:hypothetical protein